MQIAADNIRSIERKSERIAKLSHEDAGNRIVFKARVHHARAMSKHILFLVFRQSIGTVQGVLTEGETVSQNMLLWAESINNESIVWVEGVLQIPQNDQNEVKSSSVRDIEVKIEKVCPPPATHLCTTNWISVVCCICACHWATIPSRGCFTPHRRAGDARLPARESRPDNHVQQPDTGFANASQPINLPDTQWSNEALPRILGQ